MKTRNISEENFSTQFKNKIVVVTGSTQGSGAETAKLLAKRGAKGITICGRNEKNGKKIKEEIELLGTECIYVKADLENLKDCKKIIAKTDKKFGTIHSLINSAAFTERGTILSTTPKNYEKMFESKKILILELENIHKDYKKIFSFLKIKPFYVDFTEKVNENKISKNFIGDFTLKNRGLIEKIKLIIPTKVSKYLKKTIYSKGEITPIRKDEAIELKNLIKKDYKKFKTTLNERL